MFWVKTLILFFAITLLSCNSESPPPTEPSVRWERNTATMELEKELNTQINQAMRYPEIDSFLYKYEKYLVENNFLKTTRGKDYHQAFSKIKATGKLDFPSFGDVQSLPFLLYGYADVLNEFENKTAHLPENSPLYIFFENHKKLKMGKTINNKILADFLLDTFENDVLDIWFYKKLALLYYIMCTTVDANVQSK